MIYRTEKQKAALDERHADEALRQRIQILRAVSGVTSEGLAARIGMSAPTLSRRMKDPGTFTVYELRAIAREEKKRGLEVKPCCF